ncbi:uncharacterized protein LOC129616149 [Condylostylus longicornis]|uniref:uncharacterized protein LOC129616149 n=1 Tax=Condylostylus longicornis TaxID=2530218 RepID=UPI00244DAE6B|nr:uncharacterized protein LOC129616149 [Condylostylus longicornis]
MINLKETCARKIITKSSPKNFTGSEENDCNEIIDTVVTQNCKINRLIEEINTNYTRKQIAVLFLEIAEKPEICTNFNISLPYYLQKYLSCSADDVCLSETGVFILCAAKIYSRRVDSIFDNIQQMLAGIEKSSNEIQKSNLENNNDSLGKAKDQLKLTKRPSKRSLPKDDTLYESEIEPKLFKKAVEEKICDKNLTTNIFEPPKNYFRCFRKYLEYRLNNKKVQKDGSRQDESADPFLYKYSTIEDFDYEDDIDSKRNYKTLHGHIEHRYSTVLSDINFLMHFKVKDFVEEELEEIERQLSLGLPQTPKRKWYSLCHNEYINGLLDLENEVLEKEFDANTTFFKRRRKRNKTNNENEKTDDTNIDNVISKNSKTNTANFDKESEMKANSEFLTNQENEDKNIFKQDQSITNISKLTNQMQYTEDRHKLLVSDKILAEPQISSEKSMGFKDCNVLKEDDKKEEKHEQEKVEETIDPKKIIVRLSCDDEGIFLSDLDDVQSAMINPKVIAVDIRKSIDKGIDFFSINLDRSLENFLGLDETENVEEEKICPLNIFGIENNFISYKEDFSLPFDFFVKKIPINLNIFKIPEKKLRVSKSFFLPEEYNLFKCDRLKKRTRTEKGPRIMKEYTDFFSNPISLLNTTEESDFLGFSQEEIDSNIITKQKIDEYRQRTVSTDSGIFMSKALNSFSSTLVSNISQNDSGYFNEKEEDNLSKIISTLSQDESSKRLEKSSVETAILTEASKYSVKIIDVQTIIPPPIDSNKICNTRETCENVNEINAAENIESNAQNNELNKQISNRDEDVDFMVSENADEGFSNTASLNENLIQNQDCLETLKITEKIKLWHKHLKPILAKSKGRHHFDVFDLGTEIMNEFSAKNNNTIDFCSVMESKDPSFTSRYFLSMLLLANASNIKLNVKNRNITKPASPEDIEIILLSTKRHVVSVEDNIGMINNKKNSSVQNNVQFFSKPSKTIKKSVHNDDNDSGFFSNLSSISSHNDSR